MRHSMFIHLHFCIVMSHKSNTSCCLRSVKSCLLAARVRLGPRPAERKEVDVGKAFLSRDVTTLVSLKLCIPHSRAIPELFGLLEKM